jgi:predicted phosphodiesterase
MKIQLLSDLHLEAHPHWRAQPAAGADVLVLAGDIGSYQKGSLLSDAQFGLAQFSPGNGWPTPVIFVPGNHEYDTFDFDVAHARLQEVCRQLGLIWLEREIYLAPWKDQQGRAVRFVGTTLWSDFDALATPDDSTGQLLKAREKAFRAANFYLQKTGITRNGAPFLAEPVRDLALVCQQWLQNALSTPFDGSTVVVTHFAPSLLSADPRYGNTPGTAGFCNSLDPLLPMAKLWLHGHLHAPSDYRSAGCHVIANPLGYARKNEQARFMSTSIIEI